LTDDEQFTLDQKTENDFEAYNKQQRVQINKLSKIFKESTSAVLQKKFEEGLQVLRNFVKENKTNVCTTKREMSDRLRCLYENLKEFIFKNKLYIHRSAEVDESKELDNLVDDSEAEEVDDYEEEEVVELEQIDEIMTNWYLILELVKGVRSHHAPTSKQEERDVYLERIRPRRDKWTDPLSGKKADIRTLLCQMKQTVCVDTTHI
jgi:hypothetical protein